jgi:hypothetical protein
VVAAVLILRTPLVLVVLAVVALEVLLRVAMEPMEL